MPWLTAPTAHAQSRKLRRIDLARQVPSAVLPVLGSEGEADDGSPLAQPVRLAHAGHPVPWHGVLELERQLLANRQLGVVYGGAPGTVGPGVVGARVWGEAVRTPNVRLDLLRRRTA